MIWTNFLLDYLADGSKHFLLAVFLGWLAFSWMWTTLFAGLSGVVFLTQRKPSTAVVYGILTCCLLAGLSAALASHWALDYYTSWYFAPLGPPLELNLPQG